MSDSYNNRCRPNGQPRQLVPRATANWPIPVPPPPPQQYQHCSQPAVVLSKEQETRLLEAWTTKLARTKRKMARQIRAHLKTSSSSSSPKISSFHSSNSSSPCSSTVSSVNDMSFSVEDQEEEQKLPNNAYNYNNQVKSRNDNSTVVVEKQDLYSFFAPDNKRLRMLLTKELKNSDVGSLGRIVLPKREAEDKLPSLHDKEGIQVILNDIYSDQKWGLRYKYWTNNKSRMYVLENTGDFVKHNGLSMGDSITLFEDESKNLYVGMKRRNKSDRASSIVPEPFETSCNDIILQQHNQNDTNHFNNINNINNNLNNSNDTLKMESYEFGSMDEDDITSLAFMIEQLDRKDQLELEASRNSFLVGPSLSDDHNHMQLGGSVNINPTFITNNNNNNNNNNDSMSSAGLESFDDCYGGLGTLPEIDQYEYYGYTPLFDPMVTDFKH